MFYDIQSDVSRKEYVQLLQVVGSLSNLFSDSSTPFLFYRAAENIFCRSFSAENLSRGDVSADASKNGLGIGLKTFLHNNGRTWQKVAEFNKNSQEYANKRPDDIVETIIKGRNERIEFTKRAHGLNDMIYHCVTRKDGEFLVFEEPMSLVDLSSVRNIKKSGTSIDFKDNYAEYKFNLSKSTLFKRFITNDPIASMKVDILVDPFDFLLQKVREVPGVSEEAVESLQQLYLFNDSLFMKKDREEHVYLPLYSPKQGDVPERSGLNQWNAKGRPRHPDEVYIPIPLWIHRAFENFFPKRDQPFTLRLPDGKTMSAKVCQSDSKALMSNPNKALGKWLLRDLLKVDEGELVTFEMLEEIGIDSVVIHKEKDDTFAINFAKIGSFAEFESEFSNDK